MTFEDALVIWREEVLADIATEQFSHLNGLRLLKRSATEIAGALQFIRRVEASIDLPVGASSFPPPSDLRQIVKDGLIIKGRNLQLVDADIVARHRLQPPGYPSFFHHDPELGGDIEFAPATKFPLNPGDVRFTYIANYDAEDATRESEIWDGRYSEWHYIVPIYAGRATFNMIELYDRGEVFAQYAMEEIQKFAAVLGKTNLAKILIPPERRGDEGSARSDVP